MAPTHTCEVLSWARLSGWMSGVFSAALLFPHIILWRFNGKHTRDSPTAAFVWHPALAPNWKSNKEQTGPFCAGSCTRIPELREDLKGEGRAAGGASSAERTAAAVLAAQISCH